MYRRLSRESEWTAGKDVTLTTIITIIKRSGSRSLWVVRCMLPLVVWRGLAEVFPLALRSLGETMAESQRLELHKTVQVCSVVVAGCPICIGLYSLSPYLQNY